MRGMIRVILRGAVACVVGAGSGYGQNQNNQAVAGSAALPEIVVTATRMETDSEKVPQSVAVATSAEIRERHPTQPVEAVRDEPGVWIQKTGAGGGTPVVRGMMGNTVLYLVDGIRINNGRLFSGPNAFFNQVDVGSIDRIEILKGPGSVQYGSDAMGGVINMLTPALDGEFPEAAEWRGRVSGQYSSADKGLLGHGEAYYGDRKVQGMAGATYFTADDYRTGGGGTLDQTSLDSYGGFGKARVKLGEGHVLTLGCLTDVREDVERYDQSKRNFNSGLPRFFTPREERTLVYLKDTLDHDTGGISHLEPYLYYQNYQSKSDLNSEKDATTFQRDTTRQDQDMYGLGVSAVSPLLESLNLAYGVDYRYEDFMEDKDRYTWSPGGPETWSAPKGLTPDGTYDVADAFAMLDWTPIERLRLTAGARFESSHLDSDPAPQDATAGFTMDDLNLDERWNYATYSLGGIYWLTENLALSSQGATGYRAPTYSDVLSFGPFTYGVNVPSPDVDPEKCTTWEAGPRFESEALSASLTYFYTWLDDMIDSAPAEGYTDINGNGVEDAGEANYAKNNYGAGYIQGVESAAEWRFAGDWALFGTAAWTEGYDDEQDDHLRFIPPLNGTAGVRWHATDRLTLSTFARMAAAQDKVSEDDKSDPACATDPARTFPSAGNPPLRPDYSIPGFVTYHARADFTVKKGLRVFLAGDNLSDTHYREAFSRQDAPGINMTLGAEWSF